jgi:hypothetical protein
MERWEFVGICRGKFRARRLSRGTTFAVQDSPEVAFWRTRHLTNYQHPGGLLCQESLSTLDGLTPGILQAPVGDPNWTEHFNGCCPPRALQRSNIFEIHLSLLTLSSTSSLVRFEEINAFPTAQEPGWALSR